MGGGGGGGALQGASFQERGIYGVRSQALANKGPHFRGLNTSSYEGSHCRRVSFMGFLLNFKGSVYGSPPVAATYNSPCAAAISVSVSVSCQNISLSAHCWRLGWDWFERDWSSSTHATRELSGSSERCAPLLNLPANRPLWIRACVCLCVHASMYVGGTLSVCLHVCVCVCVCVI